MAISDLFSKRKKAASAVEDVYTYDQFPDKLAVQIVHIWSRMLPPKRIVPYMGGNDANWSSIESFVAEEHGLFVFGDDDHPYMRCQNYLMKAGFDERMDLIEISFRYASNMYASIMEHNGSPRQSLNARIESMDEAIDDLNLRFRENAVGYQYERGQILRVDSQFLHQEATKPALTLLFEKGFEGPQEEFMKAHEHYRHERYKEALNDALKAFESTMKAICTLRKWTYDPKRATASDLIKIMFDKKLIPDFMQTEFDGLRSLLVAGVPTVRNKMGGHGQGPAPVPVPEHLAAYALHMCASNVVFLVKAHKAMS